MDKSKEHRALEEAFDNLRIELEEANDIIHAIRSGEVDALVVKGKDGPKLFTLKGADQTYRIFIEQMTESALTLDKDGRVLYCNLQFSKLLGIPLEKVIGSNFFKFVAERDIIFAQELIEGAWDVDTRSELTLSSFSSIDIQVQLSLKALNLDDGTALSLVITDLRELKRNQLLLEVQNAELEEARKITDKLNNHLERSVSERTKELALINEELRTANEFQLMVNNQLIDAVNRLSESEDNLQSAFNAGDLGSCSVELATGKVEMSEKYRQLYGLPSTGDVDWAMVTKSVEPEFLDEINLVLENCIKYGTPVDSTYPIRHLISGDRRWMRVVGKVRRDTNGKPESVYAVVMDVTIQKEDEQRKSDFIAMVSHELKTPLTSMKGFVQILRMKAKQNNDDFASNALEKTDRQVNKMTTMINGFLNVSRLESGKMVLDIQKTEISALINEVKEEYETTSARQNIVFISQKEIWINADKDKIGHVINNLISNAIKYSSADSMIYINYDIIGKYLQFSVKDNGMGISASDLTKLFERYYRVENSQTDTISGFGIGLYLSAQIIERHGGRIWAESEIGVGSVFYFTLPL